MNCVVTVQSECRQLHLEPTLSHQHAKLLDSIQLKSISNNNRFFISNIQCFVTTQHLFALQVYFSVMATTILSSSQSNPLVLLQPGWDMLYQNGILKLQSILEHGYQQAFNNEEYIALYSYVCHGQILQYAAVS